MGVDIGSLAGSAMPSLDFSGITTQGINAGADSFLQGASPSLAGIADSSLMADQLNNLELDSSLWSDIGNGLGKATDFLRSDQAANLGKLGFGAYNMYNQNQAMKTQNNILNKQEARAAAADSRQTEREKRLRNLNYG